MQAPLVSVTLPVANGETFLCLAIESVLSQSFSDFELVIINDGSTDGTREVITGFQDERIVAFHCEKRGLTASLNFGLEKARAPLVARMDADDICSPDRLKVQVTELCQRPEVAVLGGGAAIIDEWGRMTGSVYLPPKTHEGILWGMLGLSSSTLIHPTVVFRKDVVARAGGYNERFSASQDLDLWLRLSEFARLSSVSEVVLQFRQHPHSVSRERSDEQLILSMAARVCYYLRRRGLADPSRASDETWRSFVALIKHEVVQSGVLEASAYREEFRRAVRARSFEKLCRLCVLVLQNPGRLNALRFRQKYLQTLDHLVMRLDRATRKASTTLKKPQCSEGLWQ